MVSEWKKFEIYCEKFLRAVFDERKWKIDSQVAKEYKGGITKIIDIHVRQSRQGGNSLIFDAKYYLKSDLPKKAVKDTYEYKKKSRASAAYILCPQETKISVSAKIEAKKLGVVIIPVKYYRENTRNYHKLINSIRIKAGVKKKFKPKRSWWPW